MQQANSMKIEGQENLAAIFSIFHDGGISRGHIEDNLLHLEIKCQYLAERINPTFRIFHVNLFGISGLHFSTWPSNPKNEPITLRNAAEIFSPELEILEGHNKEEYIQIICNQPSPKFDYCGGELFFGAASAQVTDEVGTSYSIEELGALCKGYWNDWTKTNKA